MLMQQIYELNTETLLFIHFTRSFNNYQEDIQHILY